MLEDYTHLADGLLALYEASFDERWFHLARSLMDRVLARFVDPDGGFFDTADDHERLVTRPKDVQDNAVPSGNAMAARVLLRLAAWTGAGEYRAAGERALRSVVPYVARYPTGFAQWLSAMDLALGPVVEVAVVGAADDPATAALVAEVRRGWHPNQVVALAADPGTSTVPLLADRVALDGRPTAYVCRGFVCRLPVTDASGAPRPAGRRRCRWLSRATGPLVHVVAVRGARVTAGPVEARPAATVVLLRPGSAGLEVLLTQRPTTMAFASDAHVFPGGRVDPDDAAPGLAGRSVRSAAERGAGAGWRPRAAGRPRRVPRRDPRAVRGGRRPPRRRRPHRRRRSRRDARPCSAARRPSRSLPTRSTCGCARTCSCPSHAG